MSYYALIKDGVVENVVVWDGSEGLFDDYTTHELSETEIAGPGFSAKLDSKKKWVFTPPVVNTSPEEQSEINLLNAQSSYEVASSKIKSLNEQIEDDDYSNSSEDKVKGLLSSWTSYRKALRAYISSSDGTQPLPLSPDNK